MAALSLPPSFSTYTHTRVPPSNATVSDTFAAMEDIIKIAKFQYEKLPEETKSRLIEIFKGYDHDGSGRIDPLKLLKNFAIPEFVGRDLLYINQFADDAYGRLNFDRFLAAWYAGNRRLKNCNWCEKILPAIYFACRKCEDEDHEFRLCFGCFEGSEYYHKHPAEEIDDITALKPIDSKRSPCAEDDYPVGSEIRQRYLSKELKAISEYRSRTGTNFAIMTGEIGNFLEKLGNVIYDKNREENSSSNEEKTQEEGIDENQDNNATGNQEKNRETDNEDGAEGGDKKRDDDDNEREGKYGRKDTNVNEKKGETKDI